MAAIIPALYPLSSSLLDPVTTIEAEVVDTLVALADSVAVAPLTIEAACNTLVKPPVDTDAVSAAVS